VNHLHWKGASSRGSKFPAQLRVGSVYLYSSRSGTVYPRELTAIIDTGADGVVIPESVIDYWRIPPDGTQPAEDFSGKVETRPFYLVDLTVVGTLNVKKEISMTSKGPNVLIGRSVLDKAELLLVVDGKHRRWSWGDATDDVLSACVASKILEPLPAWRNLMRWLG
jgi:hypothetical protein